MKYPPFTDLCMFGFVGEREETVQRAAHRFLGALHAAVTEGGRYHGLPVIVLDPTPAMVSRAAGKYRYKLIMKTVNNAALRALLAELLTAFPKARENKDVSVFADINPAGFI